MVAALLVKSGRTELREEVKGECFDLLLQQTETTNIEASIHSITFLLLLLLRTKNRQLFQLSLRVAFGYYASCSKLL